MGTTQKGPDILGVCEVENQSVLEILLRHELLRKEKLSDHSQRRTR